MRFRFLALASLACTSGALALAACVGDPPVSNPPGNDAAPDVVGPRRPRRTS